MLHIAVEVKAIKHIVYAYGGQMLQRVAKYTRVAALKKLFSGGLNVCLFRKYSLQALVKQRNRCARLLAYEIINRKACNNSLKTNLIHVHIKTTHCKLVKAVRVAVAGVEIKQ